MLAALAGLLVPTALRAWLRDLIVILTPSWAGIERSTPQTLTNVGQTPVAIPFAGGSAYSQGDRFIIALPAGKITRIAAGGQQFGAQVTISLPVNSDVVVQLFKNGLATVYRVEFSTDNKALVLTYVLNGIALDDTPNASYDLRIFRTAGVSNLVVDYSTFYMVTI